LEGAEVGGDGDVHLRHLEEGVLRADPDVAGAGEVDPRADAAAMDGGDHRRPGCLHRRKGVLEPDYVAEPRFGGAAGIVARRELARRILEVQAGGEVAAAP